MIASTSPTVRAAVRLTIERFPGVTIEGLCSATRIGVYTEARAYAMKILRVNGWSLARIARGFCRKDHTTALNSVRRAEKLFADVDFEELARRLNVVALKSAPSPTHPPAEKRENKAILPAEQVGQIRGLSTDYVENVGSVKFGNLGTKFQTVTA